MTGALGKWYAVLLAAAGAVLSLAVYARLPASIAVHFDLDGKPNGWMPRPVGAFFGPVFILLLAALLRGVRRIGPRREHGARFERDYEIVVASVLLLVLATHGIVIAIALGHRVPVGRLVPTLVGVLFVVTGRVMPRTRPNWWLGVRTPWTLSSDRVWVRTHRLAGHSMTGAGLVMILAGVVLPAALGVPIVVGSAVAAVLAPAVYSYLTWRREQSRGA